jgi:hypothetical protein
MAIINLENIAATASITIQLIKDYSMYESEIISSNGTIFQSTDTDTTLTFRAYKGVEDITSKILDIEWSKFYFVDDELVEDSTWGANKKGKQKVVLSKEDIEGKSIIQASGYSMIEGRRELVTTARITMIKISDIYISDITPVDPSDKMMWMDTNQTPPTLKIWSDDLKYWITSGMEVPVIKNLIRNSNFWTDIGDYYTVENPQNITSPVRVSYLNKQWVMLSSTNRRGGIRQDIQYPIVSNSNYIFSFLAYRESSNGYNGQKIFVGIYSKDDKNKETVIFEQEYNLNTSVSTIEVPFTTLNDTSKLSIYIATQNARCMFYATELSLYNSSVYYPWELCPDDVNNQMSTKLDNNRSSVFNTLTSNGSYRAIYESENQYYIRSEYITPAVASKSDLDSLSTQVTQIKNQITTLQTNYNNLQQAYTTLQTNYNNLQSKHTQDITSLTTLIEDLTARVAALEPPSTPETPEVPDNSDPEQPTP